MIAEAWDALLAMTLAVSALAVVLLALRRPLRRAFGARIAYLAWIILPCALLAALLPAPAAPIAASGMIKVFASTTTSLPVVTEVRFDARPFIVGLWLLGSMVVLAVLGLRQWRFERHLRPVRDPATVADTHVRRVRADASGPAVVGLWRPRIVLPDDFETRWSTAERELILAHEKVHIERGDTRINAGLALLGALNWFNPLFHLAAGRMRIDQELACDAGVLARHPHSRRCYAEAMLKAQLAPASFGMFPPPAACRWTDGNVLKERIAMLKQARSSRPRHVAGIVVVLVLAGAAACVTWASQSVETASRDEFAAQRMIDASLRIDIGGKDLSMHVARASGEAIPLVLYGDDGERWDIELTPTLLDDGMIELATLVRGKNHAPTTPRMIMRPGEPASMEVDPGHGMPRLRLEATLSVAGADSAAGGPADRLAGYVRLSPPEHPLDAAGQPLDGSVLLRVRVGSDGRPLEVTRVVVRAGKLDSDRADRLAAAARAAVATWTFEPARRNGTPVESEVIVPVAFGAAHGSMTRDPDAEDLPVLDEIRIGGS